ncbi:MAG: glycosyltransferase, partial [Firmicutes bacterium]|nr:glycosyltransferase [Bacillota bacterium]
TSQWNADILTKLGIDNAIVPRAIDDDYAVKYFNKIVVNNNDDDSVIDRKFNVSGDITAVTSNVATTNVIGDVTDNKKYDVVAIMTGSSDGHKNEQLLLKILDALHLRKTSFLVCALPQCDAKPFSLTDDEKYELLSQSRLFAWLSESEGFGIPPVEAMSVGTPVVHFDSIYVNTPLVNAPIHFPLSVHGFKKRESPTVHGKYFASPVYDFDEIVSEFKDALSVATSLTVKDRIALHEYVMRNYSHKVILPELKKYMGGSF